MRILFTGGGGAATSALWALLKDQHEVYFADADAEAKPANVPMARWLHIDRADQPTFLETLLYRCEQYRIDVLVPGVDEELLRIADARTLFGCHVLLPSSWFIQCHRDKFVSMQGLMSMGIPCPQTALLGHWNGYAPRVVASWPCIVKPRRGRGSRDIKECGSMDEARALESLYPEQLIVQEYLHGQEYTVTCVADQQMNLRAVVPVKVGLKRGVTLRAETDHDEAVTALCVAIHQADPFSGIVNVQCIKAADGTVKPFEINPRISTTTCLAMAAGVDVLGLALSEGLALSDGLAPFRKVSLRRSWATEMVG